MSMSESLSSLVSTPWSLPLQKTRGKHFKQSLHVNNRMYHTIMHIREFSVLMETTLSLKLIK